MIKIGDKVFTFHEELEASNIYGYIVTEGNIDKIKSNLNVKYWKNYTQARNVLICHLREEVYNIQMTCQNFMAMKKNDVPIENW
jgi:hypothetical protein